MRTQSGYIKATKKDIKAMRVFLEHAKVDMSYLGGGSYTNFNSLENELDEKEYKLGQLGLENIEFILQALCEGWNNNK